MSEDSAGLYKWAGIPLTPDVFARVALVLFPDQRVRRAVLAKAVCDYHAKNGGAAGQQEPDLIAKKALQLLERRGQAQNIEAAFGMWQLGTGDGSISASAIQPNAVPQPPPATSEPGSAAVDQLDATSNQPDNAAPYEFAGINLTPALFGHLALQLFSGQTVRREVIINTVTRHHISKGGLPPTMSTTDTGRTGLSQFAEKGLVENIEGAYGMWRFSGAAVPVAVLEVPNARAVQSVTELDDPVVIQLDDPVADLDVSGLDYADDGHHVYVFDYPTYEALARANGENRWAHKIGFTKMTPDARISAQAGTAMPENPRLVWQVRHPSAFSLEQALHGILEIHGRKIAGRGTEWFITNLTEIKALVELILNTDVLAQFQT
jgi:hypothetical protein